jgi:hypothetical protein
MYYQDRITFEILKKKSDWQVINDEKMAYFQTELGAMITMSESDLRRIYSLNELIGMYNDDEMKARKIYDLEKKLAKRGARLEIYPIETIPKPFYNWLIQHKGEMVVMDFDVEKQLVWIKDCEYTIPFHVIDDVYHLDFNRFRVEEVVTVGHTVGFDHVHKCIEHDERIALGGAVLNRTIFIRDVKTNQNVFEIENAECHDDEELYEQLVEKIKHFSSKAIINI